MWISALCLSALLMVHVVQNQAAANPLAGISTDSPDVQQHILSILNGYRRSVTPTARNMVKVSWSQEAAKTALRAAQTCSFNHSPPSKRELPDCRCGENFYMVPHATGWEKAFKAFYDEENNFQFGKGQKNEGDIIGNYTQLVWHNSHLIGCAVAQCADKYFHVCHHCPAGNVGSSSYPYTAGPKCGDCPNNCDDGLCTNTCSKCNDDGNCKDLKQYCSYPQIGDECDASCTCTTEII
ncbi:cysteine-rich venom protein pseudechetoxin-like [Bufo gargarizans]|uniref:cysteine-rich venom protein pseudechetoxin-like n=1 Tax=Bufo gargarizans TaxID=30331 RepID=UPI001CF463E9|nr:cysteine-rich venom protein pseudechetoxin-like [Bufo gargarizans]